MVFGESQMECFSVELMILWSLAMEINLPYVGDRQEWQYNQLETL